MTCIDCGFSPALGSTKICKECWSWRKAFAAAFGRMTHEQYRRGSEPGTGRRERIKRVLSEIENSKVVRVVKECSGS